MSWLRLLPVLLGQAQGRHDESPESDAAQRGQVGGESLHVEQPVDERDEGDLRGVGCPVEH